MDSRLAAFISILRSKDVRVSTDESIDAFNVLKLTGFSSKTFLRESLSFVLAKTTEEKEIFYNCFDSFFSFNSFTDHRDSKQNIINDFSQNYPEPTDYAEISSNLGKMLVFNNTNELSLAMVKAADFENLNEISFFMQKGRYARQILNRMGDGDLSNEIRELMNDESIFSRQTAQALVRGRKELLDEIIDYVEQQFLLHADEKGRKLREETLKSIKLSHIEKRDLHILNELVRKMSKRLVALNSRKRKDYKHGRVDIRKTLRKNISNDGILIDTFWKTKKRNKPAVYVICDVSGSVRSVSGFLLMFLYSMNDVIQNVRSFVFSSGLNEVTELFTNNPIEDAIIETLDSYGNGLTDYGQAFADFSEQYINNVDNRTTIIILGDGRNNYGNLRIELLKKMYERSKKIIWLNPEPVSSCLLYTSPSPRDVEESRMPSSA